MVLRRKALWKVHVVDLGKLFKIYRVVKFLIQNLTRCKMLIQNRTRRNKCDSKSDQTKKIWFKIWRSEFFFIQNRAFYKNFSFEMVLFRKKNFFKIMLLKNIFSSKSCFFKIARKTQDLRILQSELTQNVIFCVHFFFKIVLFKNNFFFKIVL